MHLALVGKKAKSRINGERTTGQATRELIVVGLEIEINQIWR